MLCGSPSWSAFADKVVQSLVDYDALDEKEAAELKALGDPRKTLSIAKNIAEREGISIDYDRILHPVNPSSIGIQLYTVLQRLRPVFVTTNYDKWLHRTQEIATVDGAEEDVSVDNLAAYRQAEVFKPEHFTSDKLSRLGAVIHLHGSYTEPSSMVISLRDYVRHYSNRSVLQFLSDMFKDFTVLFVGYGLAEMEILEQIIRVTNTGPASTDPRHFILLSSKSDTAKQTEFMKEYFRDECGVGVLPYIVDNGYAEILSVLENWSTQIEVKPANILELQRRIDKFVANDTEADRRASALSLVAQNPKLQAYFLSKLSSTLWFDDLDKANYFNADRIVGYAKNGCVDSSWPTHQEGLAYIERICKSGDIVPAARILEILQAITDLTKEDRTDTWRTCWPSVRILSLLPVSYIEFEDLQMIRIWLTGQSPDFIAMEVGNGLLKNLLKSDDKRDAKKALALVSLIIDNTIAQDIGTYNDGIHLKDAICEKMELFGERCGREGVILLRDKLIEKIGSPERDAHTYISRRSVEQHEYDKYSESILGVLIDALRDALQGAGRQSVDDLSFLLQTLLESPYRTLGRVGVHFATQFYESAAQTFWQFCPPAYFSDPGFAPEFYRFLKKSFDVFDVHAKSKFLAIVATLPGEWPDDPKVDIWKDEHRRDLLAYASASKDPMFNELYAALVQRVGLPPNDLDPVPESAVSWGGENSPLSPDEILRLTDVELKTFMKDFIPQPGVFNGPSYRGLGDAISSAIQASTDGYKGRLGLFFVGNPAYSVGAISALKARLDQKTSSLDWSEVLDVIADWNASTNSAAVSLESTSWTPMDPTHDWVTGEIAGLIKAGLISENNRIPKNLIPLTTKILTCILNNQEALPTENVIESLTTTINSPYGKILETIIHVVSVTRRMDKSDAEIAVIHQDVWTLVKPIFDAELERANSGKNLQCSTLMGLYLPEIYWTDKKWVEENFNKIFSKNSHDAWRCAAEGFAYQSHQFEWQYKALRYEGHIEQMLRLGKNDKKIWTRAVQGIGLAYINGLEDIDEKNGLMFELIESMDEDALLQLCWYFWQIRKSDKAKFSQRVLRFWQQIDARLQCFPNEKIAGALNQLSVYLNELNEIWSLIWQRAIKSISSEKHSYEHIIIGELKRLLPIFPSSVAPNLELFLMKSLVQYKENDVKWLVEKLAEVGYPERARNICIFYNENGAHMLDETYKKIRDM